VRVGGGGRMEDGEKKGVGPERRRTAWPRIGWKGPPLGECLRR
jgi:hypothetical protein